MDGEKPIIEVRGASVGQNEVYTVSVGGPSHRVSNRGGRDSTKSSKVIRLELSIETREGGKSNTNSPRTSTIESSEPGSRSKSSVGRGGHSDSRSSGSSNTTNSNTLQHQSQQELQSSGSGMQQRQSEQQVPSRGGRGSFGGAARGEPYPCYNYLYTHKLGVNEGEIVRWDFGDGKAVITCRGGRLYGVKLCNTPTLPAVALFTREGCEPNYNPVRVLSVVTLPQGLGMYNNCIREMVVERFSSISSSGDIDSFYKWFKNLADKVHMYHDTLKEYKSRRLLNCAFTDYDMYDVAYMLICNGVKSIKVLKHYSAFCCVTEADNNVIDAIYNAILKGERVVKLNGYVVLQSMQVGDTSMPVKAVELVFSEDPLERMKRLMVRHAEANGSSVSQQDVDSFIKVLRGEISICSVADSVKRVVENVPLARVALDMFTPSDYIVVDLRNVKGCRLVEGCNNFFVCGDIGVIDARLDSNIVKIYNARTYLVDSHYSAGSTTGLAGIANGLKKKLVSEATRLASMITRCYSSSSKSVNVRRGSQNTGNSVHGGGHNVEHGSQNSSSNASSKESKSSENGSSDALCKTVKRIEIRQERRGGKDCTLYYEVTEVVCNGRVVKSNRRLLNECCATYMPIMVDCNDINANTRVCSVYRNKVIECTDGTMRVEKEILKRYITRESEGWDVYNGKYCYVRKVERCEYTDSGVHNCSIVSVTPVLCAWSGTKLTIHMD